MSLPRPASAPGPIGALVRSVSIAVRGLPVRAVAPTSGATPPPPLPGGLRTLGRGLRRVLVGTVRTARYLRLVARHGRAAPRADERVWIVPRECRFRLAAHQIGDVGVVGGEWTAWSRRNPHEASAKMYDMIRHFRDGMPWTSSIRYRQRFEAAEARGEAFDAELVAARRVFLDDCARYDRIFAAVRREGRLRTVRELAGEGTVRLGLADRLAWWREPDGVRVSIGADGAPIWSGDGSHRLAMAIALDLPEMPARLMAVHPEALPGWRGRLRAGRRRSSGTTGSD